jgi:hypothetical protein
MTKNEYTQLSISIEKLGTHLLQVTNHYTGKSTLKWNWEALEQEVKSAILAYESKLEKKSAKKNIIVETEKKVTKSRAKKTDTVVKETKKPAAKKPAAKKATTKKSK